MLVVRGTTLTIDPGAVVRMAPGVSLIVQGTLNATGSDTNRILFINNEPNTWWESLVAEAGGQITLDHTDLIGGGSGGKVVQSTSSSLMIQNATMTKSSGQIWALNSTVQLLSSEITANHMPYGAAIELTYTKIDPNGVSVTVSDNRIHDNGLSAGSAPLKVVNNTTDGVVTLMINNTLFSGQSGPDLEIVTDGQLDGDLWCNTFTGGSNGLSVRTEHGSPTLSPILKIHNNVIEKHTPPNNPVYQQLKIGRGASSDLSIDMSANWWGNAAGPYSPDRNTTGKGEAVGVNIVFASWMTERPGCAK